MIVLSAAALAAVMVGFRIAHERGRKAEAKDRQRAALLAARLAPAPKAACPCEDLLAASLVIWREAPRCRCGRPATREGALLLCDSCSEPVGSIRLRERPDAHLIRVLSRDRSLLASGEA